MRNIVGPKVREAREKAKFTQAQLAVKLQVLDLKISRDGIAKIETGDREVTDSELVKLAKALHVGVNWLVGTER